MNRRRDAAACKQIFNLADCDDRARRRPEPIQQCLAGGRQRKIAAIRRPLEMARSANERAGDDAADAQPFAGQPVGDFARTIELRNRHDFLVRGDLKHAVGRRVHDPVAGLHVLGAELVDDHRARRGLVAEHAAAGLAREIVEEFRRESVWEDRKRAIEHDAHHLPVTRDGILAGRSFGHAADGSRKAGIGALTGGRAERGDAAETKRAQGRQGQRHGARDVAERVAAFVAVRRGIRQRADSDAVEDNDDGSGGRGHALVSGEGVIEHLVDGCDRGGRVAGAVKPP